MNLSLLIQRSEPFVVAIVDHGHTLLGDTKFLDDIVFLEIGNGDDAPALMQDAGHHQTAIQPSHILIERLVLFIARLQEDNVVEGEYEGNVSPDGGGVAGTMQQLDTRLAGSPWQCHLLP